MIYNFANKLVKSYKICLVIKYIYKWGVYQMHSYKAKNSKSTKNNDC